MNGIENLTATISPKNNNTYGYETEILSNKKSITVKFVNNEIIVNYTTTDADSKIKNINGTYTKSKTLTAEDIVNNKF